MTKYATRKFNSCIKLARECSRDSWQHAIDAKQAKAYRQTSRECIQDARYWLTQI